MVDTGSQKTVVNLKDLISFVYMIPRATASMDTPSSSLDVTVLPRCSIGFNLGQTMLTEILLIAYVSNPNIHPQDPESMRRMMRLPSVIGLDILSRYHVSIDSNFITLEK